MTKKTTSVIKNSNIEWTGPTWNPWRGCIKKVIELSKKVVLREDCRNCYMHRDQKRFNNNPNLVVRAAQATFNKPIKIQKEVDKGLRSKPMDKLIFTCSWSDWFNSEADKWRDEAWEVIRKTPDLTYQILTKLPSRIGSHLPPFWDEIRGRIWFGYSCGMPGAEKEIQHLLGHGNALNFLSCEPLLGLIRIEDFLLPSPLRPDGYVRLGRQDDCISWVIAGGESGPDARPMHPVWLRFLLDSCNNFSFVPLFFKQWGEWMPSYQAVRAGYDTRKLKRLCINERGDAVPWRDVPQNGVTNFYKVGKKKAGAMYQGFALMAMPYGNESGGIYWHEESK